jgi:hypothetical protein
MRFPSLVREGFGRSGPPGTSVVLGVRKHVPDINFLSVVMDGCDQSELVASDVKASEPVHLTGRGERDPQIGEGNIVRLSDNGELVIQTAISNWMRW